MILKLDPRYPVVWRTPLSLQLGIDPPIVRIDDVSETQERLIWALTVGVTRPGLAMIAGERHDECDTLLELLAPALRRSTPEVAPTVAITGTGPLVDAAAAALASSNVLVLLAASPDDLENYRPALAIGVAHYVVSPSLRGAWLRRDIPHLPVVFSDTGVLIGPIVEPGIGPCLHCLDLHRRDADPAWPTLASQLHGRRSAAESAVLAIEGASTVCRLALARISAGAGAAASVRIDTATGQRTERTWTAHPECGCLGLDPAPLEFSAGRPESDWAAELRNAPGPRTPTTVPASAWPA